MGDVRGRAGAIRRSGGDYLLQPLQATLLNGASYRARSIAKPQRIDQFGERVRLLFTQPHPLSATARLDLLGLGKFQPHVDAVLLMADSCLIGPQTNCHVALPQWSHANKAPLTLVRRSQDLFLTHPKDYSSMVRPAWANCRSAWPATVRS